MTLKGGSDEKLRLWEDFKKPVALKYVARRLRKITIAICCIVIPSSSPSLSVFIQPGIFMALVFFLCIYMYCINYLFSCNNLSLRQTCA